MTACAGTRSSLIIAGFDLLDPASQVYLTPDGFDRGAAQPTVSDVESGVLDGAAVVGLAAGNRNPVIPFAVRAADRVTVATLVNQILAEVDQPTWQLTWTPAGGYPVVFDCYRATVSITSSYSQEENATLQTLQISCEALPYGRSPTQVTTEIVGSPVLVDAFDATPAPTITAYQGTISGALAYVTTPPSKQGSKSLDVHFAWENDGTKKAPINRVSFMLSKTPISVAAGSTDLGSVLLYFRQPVNTAHNTWYVTATVTTSDGTLHTAVGQVTLGGAATWAEMTAALDVPVPAGSTITKYTIRCDTHYAAVNPALTTHLYVDDFALTPAAVSQITDGQGSMMSVAVAGTARTPVSIALSKVGGGTFHDWCVHSPPGDTPTVQPLIPLGGATGSASYTTASTVRYDGTYSVWVAFGGVGQVGTARLITVAITESSGGSVSLSTMITPPTGNNLYYIGDVSLPINDYPAEAGITTQVTVTSAVSTDVLNDVLLLDTRGQTIVVGPSAPAKANAWADAPDPLRALGGIYSGSASDRSDASSIAQYAQAASALIVGPGTSTLLVFSPEGALQGSAAYYPRWLQEATQ